MSSEFTLCPSCGKMFEEPVTFDCFHTFCFQCVSKPNEKYVCSICNFEQNGSGINTDNFTQTFCDVIRMERKLKNDCFGCAENCASNYCFDCQDSYCSECSKHHQEGNSNTHEIVPFASILEHGFEKRKSILPLCQFHSFGLTQFCMTCKRLVCGDCVISEHKGHWCLPSQKALTQSAGDIKTISKSLRRFHVEYHKQCLLVLDYLEKERDRIKNEIKALFLEIRQILEEREKSLIRSVDEVFNEEKKRLKERERVSSRMCSSAAAASTKLTFINKYGTATEMLAYHSRIKESKLSAYCASHVQFLPKAVVNQSSSLISEIDSLLERLNCTMSHQKGDYVKRLLNR